MKIRRYKKVTKSLGFFINNFGFRQPFQLLADGTFCFAALNNKVNIANDLPKYLQSEIKLITTQCTIIEMEKLGPKLHGALLILKKYVIHKCGHEGKSMSGSNCLSSMVAKGNPSHYIICTQDRELQDKIRNIPGVPLLYFHIKTPVLEQPSEASIIKSQQKMTGITQSELKKLEELKAQEGLAKSEQPPKKRKKKGPNPLSCKKKKRQPQNTQNNPLKKKVGKPEIEKHKRKKVRIPQHVREELFKNKVS